MLLTLTLGKASVDVNLSERELAMPVDEIVSSVVVPCMTALLNSVRSDQIPEGPILG